MRSSGLLRRVQCYFLTDVPGLHITSNYKGQEFLTLEDGTDTMSRNVGQEYNYMQCSNLDERRSVWIY
jgi:hypothetical protein